PSRGEVKAPGPWGLSPVSLGLLAPESGFLAAQGLSNVNASLEEAGYGGGGRTAAGPILLSWAKPRTGRLAPLNCGAAAGIAGPWQKSHPHRWRHPGGGQSLKIRLCQLQKRCHHEQKQWGQLGHRVTSQKDMDSYNMRSKAATAGHNPEDQKSRTLVLPRVTSSRFLHDPSRALPQTQLLHYVHVAINNMVRQCSPSTHGAPKSMDLFSKLDLIQDQPPTCHTPMPVRRACHHTGYCPQSTSLLLCSNTFTGI
uniref:Uncharacterized LOC103669876 n=1 Tax=Ursus maritimus TaxID=29073 RepID=A0A452TCM7_URSMA